jgi:adenylate cyclase
LLARGRFLRGGGRAEDRDAALEHAHAELAAGCDDATALAMVGFVIHQLGHDALAASDVFERALEISPSSIFALSWSALVLVWTGEFETAIQRAERSRRLSPFDPFIFAPNMAIAQAHFLTGHYAEAAVAARRAVDANPRFVLSSAVLAAALVQLKHFDEAKAVVERAPKDLIAQVERMMHLGQTQHVYGPVLATLREAGLAD